MKNLFKFQGLLLFFACSLGAHLFSMELDSINSPELSYTNALYYKIYAHGILPENKRCGGMEIYKLICYIRENFADNDTFAKIFMGSLVSDEAPIVVAAKLNDAPIVALLFLMAKEYLSDDQWKEFINKITAWIVDGPLDQKKLSLFRIAHRGVHYHGSGASCSGTCIPAALSYERLKLLLLNQSSLNGKTSLMAAVSSGDVEVVEKLIQRIEKVITSECDKKAIAQFFNATINYNGLTFNCFDFARNRNKEIYDYLITLVKKYAPGSQPPSVNSENNLQKKQEAQQDGFRSIDFLTE